MKLDSIRLGLTYDDILLVPQKSNVTPSEVDMTTTLTKGITLHTPILSAAMDTVSEGKLAIALAKVGGLAIIHKNMTIERQASEVKMVKAEKGEEAISSIDQNGHLLCGAAVGVATNTLERVDALAMAGVDVVCLDSAHGHSFNIMEMAKKIKAKHPALPLIVGNIVTKEAALDLIEAGADVVKVGIGPGSICTTRVVAGVGVPQASAVEEVVSVCKQKGIGVIADGGIKHSGDIVKALALGADAVMLGSLLAGVEEAPGEVFEENDKKFKAYVGMGSLAAMERGSADRYFQKNGTPTKKLVPEGIEAKVPYKGPLADTIYQLIGGIKSGMGYCGAKTLQNLYENSVFVRITNAGLIESHPHDVALTKDAPNYHR